MQNNQISSHEQTNKKLNQLEHDELLKQAIHFQNLSKQYHKELTKCEKKIEKLVEKKTRKTPAPKPNEPEYEIPHFVREIADLVKKIRHSFPYGGKEHHFQAALEIELREQGIVVSQEVARLLHYKTQGDTVRQLPHDIRGREDILLPDKKYIIELKQIKTLTLDDHRQLLRYMDERKKYNADWGNKTKGLLINFGDIDIEIWYMFYIMDRPQRIKICQLPILDLNDFSDAWSIE